ncbi:MAG: hypothetical protein ABIH25_03540, partial [Candidatus Woesearchaeota archaeon]
ATTIQVSEKLVELLRSRKMYENETYEEVIIDLIEDTMELSDETKKEMAISRKEIKEGKVHSFEDIKKEFNL